MELLTNLIDAQELLLLIREQVDFTDIDSINRIYDNLKKLKDKYEAKYMESGV